MCNGDQQALCESIAGLMADYRQNEIQAPTPAHVEHWVSQFEAPVRLQLLNEQYHILQRTYFPKEKVTEFLTSVARHRELVGENPREFWQQTGILDIQLRGRSQKDMLAIFNEILQREYGITIAECDHASGRFVYFDDAVFSGGHVKNDVIEWLPQAPQEMRLILVAMAIHTGSLLYMQQKIMAAATQLGKRTTFEPWWHIAVQNRRDMRNSSEVLWPSRISDDPLVTEYAQMLTQQGFPPTLRTAGAMGNSRIFSSEASRDLFEQEMLRAGVRIRRDCPHLNEHQHPLGNTLLRTFGFGSLIVTHRNCPNNNPLALWASDPWYPLFPRRTN